MKITLDRPAVGDGWPLEESQPPTENSNRVEQTAIHTADIDSGRIGFEFICFTSFIAHTIMSTIMSVSQKPWCTAAY